MNIVDDKCTDQRDLCMNERDVCNRWQIGNIRRILSVSQKITFNKSATVRDNCD